MLTVHLSSLVLNLEIAKILALPLILARVTRSVQLLIPCQPEQFLAVAQKVLMLAPMVTAKKL